MKHTFSKHFAFFLLLFLANSVFAQNNDVNNSPYDVVYNHAHFLKKNSYDELQSAASFNIPNKKKRINAAVDLNEIIYGKGVDLNVLVNKIPDNPDYIDSATRRHIYVVYDKLPQVYVEKIGDKWYYSQTTVDALPQLHKQVFPFGTNIWASWFSFKSNEKFFKLYPWQWIAMAIITTVFLLCFFLLRYFFRFIFNKILFRKYVREIQDLDKIKLVSNLFSIWVGTKVLQIFLPTLFINAKYALPIIRGIAFVAAALMVLIVYKLVELFIFYMRQYAEKTEAEWDNQVIMVLQKFMKFIVIFLGLFFVLNTLDINIATIIAGLSVGGLALALAAQDTVKNFIASVMIFIDKPFRIGDSIKGDNFEGIVQEVGFRSTRIKTGDDSLVYIANAKLSEMTIDNKGFRVFRKFKTDLMIPFDTPLYKVERFLEAIRTILMKYPYTKNASIDVFLTNIQATGMTITVNYKYKIYNLREELQHREFILMNILKVADLMQIKLFENNQVLVQPQTEIVSSVTVEDLDQQLSDFFAKFDANVTQVI